MVIEPLFSNETIPLETVDPSMVKELCFILFTETILYEKNHQMFIERHVEVIFRLFNPYKPTHYDINNTKYTRDNPTSRDSVPR